MHIRGLVLLAGLVVCGGVHAKEHLETMRFTVFRPCMGNASFCQPQLLASGTLDKGAPERLAALLDSEEHPLTVSFDSPGGSLLAGLELGKLIREHGLNTVVGTEYFEERYNEALGATELISIAKDVGCYSACAYAFMGGVSRALEGDSPRLGVHQFYGGDVETAEAMTQGMLAIVSQYMAAMGVSRDVLDLASLTQSADMYLVPPDFAAATNLDNQHPVVADWQLKALDSGELALTVDQQTPGGDRHTHFVMLNADDSASMLVLVVQRNLTTSTEKLMGRYVDGGSQAGELCAGDSCYELVPLTLWEYSAEDASLTGTFRISFPGLVQLVTSKEQLRYNAGFPNRFYRQAPSADFGRSGLRSGLMALIK